MNAKERAAIDSYLSQKGINIAAMLRAESNGHDLDEIRVEAMRLLQDDHSFPLDIRKDVELQSA